MPRQNFISSSSLSSNFWPSVVPTLSTLWSLSIAMKMASYSQFLKLETLERKGDQIVQNIFFLSYMMKNNIYMPPHTHNKLLIDHTVLQKMFLPTYTFNSCACHTNFLMGNMSWKQMEKNRLFHLAHVPCHNDITHWTQRQSWQLLITIIHIILMRQYTWRWVYMWIRTTYLVHAVSISIWNMHSKCKSVPTLIDIKNCYWYISFYNFLDIRQDVPVHDFLMFRPGCNCPSPASILFFYLP